MISTPSYPAERASAAQRAKSSMVPRTSLAESADGVNQPIGAFLALGATEKGWYA